MDSADGDLGSAGPILLPLSSALLGGGKEGVFYLLDPGHMGHLEDGSHPPLQKFQASQAADNTLADVIEATLLATAAYDLLVSDPLAAALLAPSPVFRPPEPSH